MSTGEAFQSIRFGNYLLVSQLGRGGMAEVYKARLAGVQGFQKTVCVKRILHRHGEDKHFIDMFVNEAKISARLSHPNIVQVYELGEVDGEVFMAMEFVNGRDLLRVMRAVATDGPPPPPVAAYIAREMCRALACAHDYVSENGQRQPIIHRDVSPQNVMVSYDGIVKLVDFGIAKALAAATVEETRTGALKGKFAYMAPEQLEGQKASPLTDVFAAGVTLFETLTGRRLFKGPTDYETLNRVKTQPIPPPSLINPKVPPELDQIVATALQRDPAKRYQRAAQMARDLEQFCGRIGFTTDDMKEFMEKLFPNREEIPDGIVAPPTPQSNDPAVGEMVELTHLTNHGKSAQTTDNVTNAGRPSALGVPPKRPGQLRFVFAGAAITAVVGGLSWLLLAPQPPRAVTAMPLPSVAAVPAPAPIRVEPAATKVTVESIPEGAEVLEGPKLLGTTPVIVSLTGERGPVVLRLTKSGYEELSYSLALSDGPRIVLKLTAKRHHGAPAANSHSATDPSFEAVGEPPKINAFEDDPVPQK